LLALGERDLVHRRQQRLGDVLSRAAIAVALLVLVTGCGGGSEGAAAQDDTGAVVAHAVTPPPVATAADTPDALPTAEPGKPKRKRHRATSPSGAILSAADRASFQQLAASLGGESGLAVSGVGAGRKVEKVGGLQSVIAWSTAKVPVAMAAIDAGVQDDANLTAAITASDNAAATRLWSALGAPENAAAAANEELRRGGDQRTQVESRTLRSGFTPFGQTLWTLSDQARFTAAMPCSAAGVQVLGLMGNVVAAQRWGLGAAGASAQLKGGWGPGSSPGAGGGYLDRQMGIVTVRGKPLAVAIASRPSDGSHESGTRSLTAIARWLVAHADARAQPAQAAC
jgi:hypothetical protein